MAAFSVVQMFVNSWSERSCEGREKKLKGEVGLKGLLLRFDWPGIHSGSSAPDVGLQGVQQFSPAKGY